MENLFEFISIAIGLFGIFYAILTNRQKTKMEHMVRIHLSGIAGNIKSIRKKHQMVVDSFRKNTR